jgi:hypothetical protein
MQFKHLIARHGFLLLVVLQLGCLRAGAQLSVGAKADVAVSWLRMQPAERFTWQERPWWGPQIGGYVRLKVYKPLFVEAQLTYNHVAARSRLVVDLVDPFGAPTGETFVAHACDNIGNLSLPILIGWDMSWCSMMVGVQGHLVLGSSYRTWGKGTIDGEEVDYNDRTRGLPIYNTDLGLTAGITAPISNRFAFEASYYHGLRNIFKTWGSSGQWYVRQVTYGVRYAIFKRV